MFWFTLAFATCLLVSGFVAFVAWEGNIVTGSSVPDFANPGLDAARPPQDGRSAGLPSSAGAKYAPREGAKVGAPESSARSIPPLNLTPLPAQREKRIGATFPQLRNLTSVPPPENPQSATAASSAVAEFAFPSPIVEEPTNATEKKTTQETAITLVPNGVGETTSDLPPAAEKCNVEGDVIALVPEPLPASAREKEQPAPSLLEFYGLKQQPFDVTPDPAYLYFAPSHSGALSSLRLGIEHLRGFMMLVAEPGMGKTTLMNKLMEELADSARVVFLFQTQCGSSELLTFILDELEVDHAGMNVAAMHRALNQALLEDMLRGQRFVLIIDEAQNLQGPVLETVRLLSNFETTHSKLIQIVLVGQLQLADSLMHRGLKQLRQRVAVLASLKPLDATQTAEYVEHRLRAAGWNGTALFTPGALAQIAKSSEGVPRSINNLCFNALLEAFLRGKKIIEAGQIQSITEELNLGALPRLPEEAEVPAQSLALADRSAKARPAPSLPAAPASGPEPGTSPEANGQLKLKPGLSIAGRVTELVRSPNWDRKREYRVQVTIERDSFPGLSRADQYYCFSFYVGQEQAAKLYAGKRVQIRIDH